MKNAIILHGTSDKEEYYSAEYPSSSNFHWLPWLQKQLLMHDIPAATPEVPNAYEPEYSIWKREFERFDVTSETILVGHSCGGGFLVRWLSEHKDVTVGKVVLVAPWLDPNNRKGNQFFDFTIDPEFTARTKGITIFNSDNDMEEVQESVRQIRDKVKNIEYREFTNHGHFCLKDLGTEAFPELLKEVLK